MRQLTMLLALFATLSITVQAAEAPEASAKAALVTLDQQWGAASAKGDVAALDRLLADEFTAIEPDGSSLDKSHYLAAVKAATPKAQAGKDYDYQVRFYGDVAVMYHLTDLTISKDGKDVSVRHRNTHLFVHRDGRWQVVLNQVTTVSH